MAHDVNALLIRIDELEAKIQFYEQHHRQCIARQQPSPPPDEEYSNGSFKIIRFEPKPVDNSKSEADLRWKNAAIQLVSGVPAAKAWVRRREDLGLDHISAIRLVSGSFSSSIVSDADGYCLPSSATDLIASGIAFAKITKRSQVDATVAVLVKTFQELIVVSLAVVYLQHGVDLSLINEMMSEISNSDKEHLSRMRRGAVWLNKVIVQLWANTHWGQRACDAVFFSGIPISKYTRLRESELCSPFIVDKLRDAKYTSNEVQNLNDIPLSIPAFIKTIVRDKLTCKEICTALGYQDFVGEITELGDQYEALLAPTKRRKIDSLNYEKIRVEGGLRWETVFNPFMGATEEGTENDGMHPESLQTSI